MYKAINMLLNYCFVVRFVRREKNMFSSNQILEVSGDLSHSNDLYIALEFALKFSGNIDSFIRTDNPSKCIYQIYSKNTISTYNCYRYTGFSD